MSPLATNYYRGDGVAVASFKVAPACHTRRSSAMCKGSETVSAHLCAILSSENSSTGSGDRDGQNH